jgi:hypothetical protein
LIIIGRIRIQSTSCHDHRASDCQSPIAFLLTSHSLYFYVFWYHKTEFQVHVKEILQQLIYPVILLYRLVPIHSSTTRTVRSLLTTPLRAAESAPRRISRFLLRMFPFRLPPRFLFLSAFRLSTYFNSGDVLESQKKTVNYMTSSREELDIFNR